MKSSKSTEKSQSSTGDSPAKTSALREKERALQAPDLVFFMSLSDRFAEFAPDTSFLRTYQRSLFEAEDWTAYCGNFPARGIMLNGVLYRPANVAQGIFAKDGSALPHQTPSTSPSKWPPPTATERSGMNTKTGEGAGLWWVVRERERERLWPTPRAGKINGDNAARFAQAREAGVVSTPPLETDVKIRQAAQLLPTPTANLGVKGNGPKGSKSHLHRLSKRHLDAVIMEAERVEGQLSADWVDVLMGYPMGYTRPEGEPMKAAIDAATWRDGSWEEGIPRLTREKKNRRARLKALGNSVVPQVIEELAELIADHILKGEPMGAHSRRKGANYERELARQFAEILPAQRGIQYRSGEEAADVECEHVWVEAKRGKRTNPKKALKQAIEAAPEHKIPIAVCRDDREEAIVTMRLNDFFTLFKGWLSTK